MRIFVYEHLCGGGLLNEAVAELRPLLCEARAMNHAVAADFAAVPGVEVVQLRDSRLNDDLAATPVGVQAVPISDTAEQAKRFDELVATCDAVLLIAPETDGLLTTLARRIERLGGRLLSPSADFCAWASDKSQVAETLQSAGVPMPVGLRLQANDRWPQDFPLPAVLKPNDGCGSQGIVLLPSGKGARRADEDRFEVATHLHISTSHTPALSQREREFRLERYVSGMAASVAMLGGPRGVFPLPACSQRLAAEGAFAYLGGSCPLPIALAARAEALALRAAAAMPGWIGYIGVDLVLGAADDGSQDYLIEVNPRLTTSYVGLRALSETNLAQTMLDVAAGREPRLSFRAGLVEFDAGGTVRLLISPSKSAG